MMKVLCVAAWFAALAVRPSQAATSVLEPTADAYIQGGSTETTNYGTDTSLKVKIPNSGSASQTRESFVTFDLNAAGITTGDDVVEAKLRFYVKNVASGGADVDVREVTSSWTESAVTWANPPTYDSTTVLATTSVTVADDEQYVEWDLTGFVSSKVLAGPIGELSFALVSSQTLIDRHVTFSSKEATSKPELVIVVPTVLNPVADTYVRGGNNADTNFGSGGSVTIKEPNNGSPDVTREAFLKFDLSSIATVQTATLRMRVSSVIASGADVDVRDVSDTTWDELAMTWNNKPVYGATPLATYSVAGTEDEEWKEVDLTAHIQQAGTGLVSLGLISNANLIDRHVSFYTKESANDPELIIIESAGGGSAPTLPPQTPQPSPMPVSQVPSTSPSKAPTGPTQTTTLIATEDAYVQGGGTESTNYGTSNSLKIKQPNSGSPGAWRELFVKFDLSTIAGSVASAKVRFNVQSVQSAGASVDVREITNPSSWSELAVTWLNKPTYETTALANYMIVTADDESYVEWDVTTFVSQKVAVGGAGVVSFAMVSGTPIDRFCTLRSRESSTPPELVIETATPSNPSPSAAPSSQPASSPIPPSAVPSYQPSPAPAPSAFTPLTVPVSEDANTREANAGTNYGADTRMDVKADDARISFVKFNIGTVTETAPTVVLRLWAYTEREVEVAAYEVADDTWDETTIAWNNQPTLGPFISWQPYPDQYASVDIDVTDYVNGEVTAGSQYVSMALVANFTVGVSVAKFYTKEWTDPSPAPGPVIPTLEFTDAAPPPDQGPPPTYVPPFDLAKFQPVLSGCRLQCPSTSNAAVSNGQFAGYATDAFQLIDSQYMQFKMTGIGNRCELRHNDDWDGSLATERFMYGRVKTDLPAEQGLTQFTIMQIHIKDFLTYPSGPFVRVNWRRLTGNLTDHIWISLRTSLDPKDTTLYPLFPRPEGFYDLNVTYWNDTLKIFYNGGDLPAISQDYTGAEPIPDFSGSGYDASNMEPIDTMYWKAGVYINKETNTQPVITQWDELTITT